MKTAKRSALMKKLWQNPEYRKRVTEAHRGKPVTLATRKKLSDNMKKRQIKPWESPKHLEVMRSPQYREKLSKAMRAVCKKPEYRKKMSARMKKAWAEGKRTKNKVNWTPERSKKRSEQSKAIWQSAVMREKILKAIRLACADPKSRKRKSEARKQRFKDPEFREKALATLNRMWANPDYRAKILSKLHSPEVRDKARNATIEIPDAVVVRLLRKTKNVPVQFPASLIDAKRAQLQLKRVIKETRKDKREASNSQNAAQSASTQAFRNQQSSPNFSQGRTNHGRAAKHAVRGNGCASSRNNDSSPSAFARYFGERNAAIRSSRD